MLFLLSAFPAKLATAKKTQIISLKLQLTWSRSLNVKDVENVQIEAGKGEMSYQKNLLISAASVKRFYCIYLHRQIRYNNLKPRLLPISSIVCIQVVYGIRHTGWWGKFCSVIPSRVLFWKKLHTILDKIRWLNLATLTLISRLTIAACKLCQVFSVT